MLLKEIIKNIPSDFILVRGDSENGIDDIVINSKASKPSNIFVAIKGFSTDGHKYIIDAYRNGCRNFVVQSLENLDINALKESTVVEVDDSRIALGILSNFIFNYPFLKLKMIGITGTKGKTTVSTLLHHLITGKIRSSLFTTVKNVIGGMETDSVRTTMESNELEKLLSKSVDDGEDTSVVEVSSHAVTLSRIQGIQWDAGIFTSFSRDHLDLYGTMEKYFEAKLDFFKTLNDSNKAHKFAVVNIDDPMGLEVVKVLNDSVKVITIGRSEKAVYFISDHKIINNGLVISMIHNEKKIILHSKLRGDFNINNIALSVAAAIELGIGIDEINARLKSFNGIPGRFEIIMDEPFIVVVDYAHTPQSLENIILEGRKLTDKKVIVVFGCTGERDKEKRPIMGEIAGKLSDLIIITNDDTYGEDPEEIAHSVEKGLLISNKVKDRDYFIILERKRAIKHALNLATDEDVIILAGMGHEKYQILKQGAVPHNDKETVFDLIR